MWSNFLCSSSPCDVHLGELVKASQDTSASHAAENVGSGALHQGHESFVLEDLHAAIQRVLVLDGSSRGHHHPPPDGINRIGHESRANGNSPSEEEGKKNASVLLSFLLGWGVTVGSGLMSYPIDTIGRRMMMTSGAAVKYKNSLDCGIQVLKNEGFMSLMKGAGANVLRGVAGAGVLAGFDKFSEMYIAWRTGA